MTIIAAAFLFQTGCAPLPPIEEEMEEQVESLPKISKAERDSIIAVHRSFGHEYWKQGNYENARAYLDTVRFYDYEHRINIYRTMADCHIQMQMPDSAIAVYIEGIRYFPDDAYLQSSLAIMFKNRGQWAEAIEHQVEAVRIKPDNTEYLMSLAELYVKNEDYDNAIATYETLAEMLPEDAAIADKLENLIKTQRDPAEYLGALKEGVEKFPDDYGRRLKYANALHEQGFDEKAVKHFKVYAEERPDDVRSWRGLAKSRDNLGEYKEAIAAYKKVVEIEANAVDDYIAIGKDYLALGKWVEARKWAYLALQQREGYGMAWVLLGDVYQSAADKASGDHPKYNDKLVFVIAYGFYLKATGSSDPQARSDGDRGMRFLKGSELVPNKADRFMHQSEIMPSGNAYAWINQDWPEVGYIDEFLKALD